MQLKDYKSTFKLCNDWKLLSTLHLMSKRFSQIISKSKFQIPIVNVKWIPNGNKRNGMVVNGRKYGNKIAFIFSRRKQIPLIIWSNIYNDNNVFLFWEISRKVMINKVNEEYNYQGFHYEEIKKWNRPVYAFGKKNLMFV